MVPLFLFFPLLLFGRSRENLAKCCWFKKKTEKVPVDVADVAVQPRRRANTEKARMVSCITAATRDRNVRVERNIIKNNTTSSLLTLFTKKVVVVFAMTMMMMMTTVSLPLPISSASAPTAPSASSLHPLQSRTHNTTTTTCFEIPQHHHHFTKRAQCKIRCCTEVLLDIKHS